MGITFKPTTVMVAMVLWSFSGSQIVQARVAANPPETPHLRFVTEFIRELAEIQDIRDDFDRQMDPAKAPNALSVSSYSFTRMTLALKSQTGILEGMRLDKPYDFLIPSITELYGEKIRLFQRLLEIDRTMLRGPKSGVDYSKLVSEMPELRAKIDDADNTLFKASPAVFMTLIDPRADSHDHVSHLVITKAERTSLLEYISISFGERLNQKDQPYGIGIAAILRDALLSKGYKCSDEPWD